MAFSNFFLLKGGASIFEHVNDVRKLPDQRTLPLKRHAEMADAR